MLASLSIIENNEIIKPAITFDSIIAKFIGRQDVKKSSKDLYTRTLKQYFIWINKKGLTMQEITRTNILEYKDERLKSGHSPLTVASYLTALRKLYAWGEANKYCMNVAREIKTPKKKQVFEKEVLTKTEGKSLNTFFKNKISKSLDLRNFEIINLIQLTGLRTIEVVRANIEDITIRQGKKVLMVQGKGRDSKDQIVVLTPAVLEPIQTYLKSRPRATTCEPLFVSSSNENRGQRLSTRFISGLAKQGLRCIGIDDRRYLSHSLRHTVGTFIYDKTGNINAVQMALRHSSPVTSQIYARKAIETASILNNPLEHMEGMFD